MRKYNKAIGSSVGGALGLLLGVLAVAGFNALSVEITPDVQASIDTIAPILGTLLGGLIGTYKAPKNE